MILGSLLIAVLGATPAAALPGASAHTDKLRFCDATAEQAAGAIEEIARLPDVRARVVAASERFLGVPYQFDPLGEGPGQPPDEDPRLRYDLADCQTFLETSLALARTRSAADLLGVLDDIRYDGPARYERRNHFFEAHWLTANVRKGYVKDATAAIGGKDAVAHVKAISAEQWKARKIGESIKLPDDRAAIGRFTLTYLPLKKLAAHQKDIPSGTLFAVVREDRPRLPTMVTHLGIVVQKPTGTVFRHAGRDLYAQVVDEELAHFVARNLTYSQWPVLGLMLLEPLEAPAR